MRSGWYGGLYLFGSFFIYTGVLTSVLVLVLVEQIERVGCGRMVSSSTPPSTPVSATLTFTLTPLTMTSRIFNGGSFFDPPLGQLRSDIGSHGHVRPVYDVVG